MEPMRAEPTGAAPTAPPAGAVRHTVTATPDPPPTGVPNPIHADDGASGAGYKAALVAGVRTYGWVTDAVRDAAGDAWLHDGWADITLRRPLFAGEQVRIDVVPTGEVGTWTVQAAVEGEGGLRVVLDGSAGTGRASWSGEIDAPAVGPALDPPPVRPTYGLAAAPRHQPLRPLGAYITAERARELATTDLGLEQSDLPGALVHPYFLAARMAPLTRHNFTYGPTIHVRTQIQHLAPAPQERRYVIGAQIVRVWERNEHWYQLLDGSIVARRERPDGTPDGDEVEVARLRHTTIFRPRGTVMPEPIRG